MCNRGYLLPIKGQEEFYLEKKLVIKADFQSVSGKRYVCFLFGLVIKPSPELLQSNFSENFCLKLHNSELYVGDPSFVDKKSLNSF